MVLRVAVAYVDDDDASAAATVDGLGTPMFFTIGVGHGLDYNDDSNSWIALT